MVTQVEWANVQKSPTLTMLPYFSEPSSSSVQEGVVQIPMQLIMTLFKRI
jgi:hypothetical protein